jgi:hypothetical protein
VKSTAEVNSINSTVLYCTVCTYIHAPSRPRDLEQHATSAEARAAM